MLRRRWWDCGDCSPSDQIITDIVMVAFNWIADATIQQEAINKWSVMRTGTFRSLMEGFDTSTPMGKFNMQIYGAVAELECGINRQRTNAGLAAARSRGHFGGRPRVMTDEDVVRAAAMLANGEQKISGIARYFGVGTSTLYRHLRYVIT